MDTSVRRIVQVIDAIAFSVGLALLLMGRGTWLTATLSLLCLLQLLGTFEHLHQIAWVSFRRTFENGPDDRHARHGFRGRDVNDLQSDTSRREDG